MNNQKEKWIEDNIKPEGCQTLYNKGYPEKNASGKRDFWF
jgi:hypothetical protein